MNYVNEGNSRVFLMQMIPYCSNWCITSYCFCMVCHCFIVFVTSSSVSKAPDVIAAIQQLRGFINKPLTDADFKASHDKVKSLFKELVNVAGSLSLVDLNYVLYRCDNEEQADRPGNGVYNIPGYGPLIYCGLQGGWI